MENNNTPRKACIYYESESIPVLVVAEDDSFYLLLLDWGAVIQQKLTTMEMEALRNKYVDALWGYEGAGQDLQVLDTELDVLSLHKEEPNVLLVFNEPEPIEAQDVPVHTTGIDDVSPQIGMHGELNQHLTILARSGYKVKSFDVSIQEGGEAHLCATFTKEVDK